MLLLNNCHFTGFYFYPGNIVYLEKPRHWSSSHPRKTKHWRL